MTIDDCTIKHFTEQAIYASNSSLTVSNCTIQNPSGASHGIYLLGGSSDPTISDNTIKSTTIGIERKDSPGAATISGNTFTFCRDGIKTTSSSPEIFNNYLDGSETGDHGVRVGSSSSPDIHDNDFFDYTIGVYVEQSEPADLKWNNFGYSGGQTIENWDAGLYVAYLASSSNTFADNNWNNFYDGNDVPDVNNQTSYTLKARGNYWDSQYIEGSVDASDAETSANSDAGPGGALGKFARQETSTDDASASLPLPKSFGLAQNFPNPFNPTTVVSFRLPTASKVTLTIYDILGRQVRSLTSRAPYAPGIHALTWDGADDNGRTVASGVYLYRIAAIGPSTRFSDSRKLLFIQ